MSQLHRYLAVWGLVAFVLGSPVAFAWPYVVPDDLPLVWRLLAAAAFFAVVWFIADRVGRRATGYRPQSRSVQRNWRAVPVIAALILGITLALGALFDTVRDGSGGEIPVPPPRPAGRTQAALLARVGAPVTVAQRADRRAQVTVLSATSRRSLGSRGPAAGRIYFAIKVRYEALTDDVTYGASDWQVYADGQREGRRVLVDFDAWQPRLSYDTLTRGRTAEGWVSFEIRVPSSFMTVSYKGDAINDEPVFELSVACCD